MRLLTYDRGDGARAGVLADGRIVDITDLLGSNETIRDIAHLLRLPGEPLERVRQRVGEVEPGLSLDDVRLRQPLLQPPTIRDFFAFEEHVKNGRARRGLEVPEAWYRIPVFYFTNPLALSGPEDEISFPAACEWRDYELEIAAVVGREGRNVAADDAMSYIAGFTILNDWSARDIQRDESSVGLGPSKGKDFASSMGPWVVTTDELAPLIKDGRLTGRMTARVNGETWSDNTGAGMNYSFKDLVAHASRDSRIVPGDVIGSGTVGRGCILEQPDRRWLDPGDTVEMEIEGIGTLRNKVVAPA
ncbi:MAG: fumarylacetoacetate hydrolase family protein [Dehalococcoidia bacterium]|nr:fumarylacetoacetate hydrolase family protein [Dehalococcoidia bacterium]